MNTTTQHFTNSEWENMYLLSKNADGEPICLVCGVGVSRYQKYHLEWYYRSCHSEYEKFVNDESNEIIKKLKEEKIFMLQTVFLDILKACGTKGKEMLKIIENTPLSRNTMVRRTEKISKYIFSMTKKDLLECKYFSLCLDESTDINNISQLLICVKIVDANLNTFEEVSDVMGMHSNVTGDTIFKILESNVFKFASIDKLSAICTDGAKVMSVSKKVFVGCFKQQNIDILTFHCIIHQQALLAKEVCLNNAMEVSAKIINKIRGGHNALSHRKLKSFL